MKWIVLNGMFIEYIKEGGFKICRINVIREINLVKY